MLILFGCSLAMVLENSVHKLQWILARHVHVDLNLGVSLGLYFSRAHDWGSFLIPKVFLLVLSQLVYRFSIWLVSVQQLVLLLDVITIEVEVLILSSLVQLSHNLWELLVIALRLLQEVIVPSLYLLNAKGVSLLRKLLNCEVNWFVNRLRRPNAPRKCVILVLFFHRRWLVGRAISLSNWCNVFLEAWSTLSWVSWRGNSRIFHTLLTII